MYVCMYVFMHVYSYLCVYAFIFCLHLFFSAYRLCVAVYVDMLKYEYAYYEKGLSNKYIT